jgi:hypothetical protein
MEDGLSAKADHDPLLRRSRVTGTAAETLACAAEGGCTHIESPERSMMSDGGSQCSGTVYVDGGGKWGKRIISWEERTVDLWVGIDERKGRTGFGGKGRARD